MSADLGARVEQYLEERRRLGFDLRCQAYCLRSLACYLIASLRSMWVHRALTFEHDDVVLATAPSIGAFVFFDLDVDDQLLVWLKAFGESARRNGPCGCIAGFATASFGEEPQRLIGGCYRQRDRLW